MIFLQKMGWASFWAIFFTNSSGHPYACRLALQRLACFDFWKILAFFSFLRRFVKFPPIASSPQMLEILWLLTKCFPFPLDIHMHVEIGGF
jgi:hypothetical protein